jgi:hypothetical protein
MKNSMLVRGLAALAVCTLVMPTIGSPKHPVERPLKLHATVTWIVSLADGSAVGYQVGEATHAGRFTDEVVGTWDLSTFTLISASGIATGANGDQISWKLPGSSFYVEWTGGTGRFENVTGGFNMIPQSGPFVTDGPVAGTITITATYTGLGTSTY